MNSTVQGLVIGIWLGCVISAVFYTPLFILIERVKLRMWWHDVREAASRPPGPHLTPPGALPYTRS